MRNRTGWIAAHGGAQRHHITVLFAALSAAACVLIFSSPASAAISGLPDSTPSVDGVVYAVVRVDDTIYFGGEFGQVGGVRRFNLAAVDANTGSLLPWSPRASCCVKALTVSPDGSRIYAGGSFTSLGGEARSHVAAIDAASGAVSDNWKPEVDSTVNALAVKDDKVFLGGTFGAVDGQQRLRLAMVSGTDGALAPTWRAPVRGLVHELRVAGGRLYVGGDYTFIAGRKHSNLTALIADTGALTSFRPRVPRPVLDLVPNGTRVYTAEGGRGGAVAAYAAARGREAWRLRAAGDAQAVAVMGGKLYVGGHFSNLGGVPRTAAGAVFLRSGKVDKRWRPRFDVGVWAMMPDTVRGKLYVGGSFKEVSGHPISGLARFSRLP